MIIEPTLPDHWKVIELKRLSGRDIAVEWLVRLWGECQRRKNAPFDANNPSAIAAICRYEDNPEEFVGWLIGLGFLEIQGSGMIAHDWATHNSQLVTNWENGKYGIRGGRAKKPKQSQRQPIGNPLATQRGPNDAPIRLDSDKIQIREEKEESSARACVAVTTSSLTDEVLGERSTAHTIRNQPAHFVLEKETTESDGAAAALIVRLSAELGSKRRGWIGGNHNRAQTMSKRPGRAGERAAQRRTAKRQARRQPIIEARRKARAERRNALTTLKNAQSCSDSAGF